ncbi:hypothetical protein [Pseudorhodoplanes sp.]|uniref:hypothetical protein n=1 Tax=Pseudorhodoplanes sp. TaxID=1934341 RepID=UPI002B6EB09A|nr:hypothetical protein [Pseudorhodoplanes sp.]HWV42256.1 hypothetical protein [Pseudorhodoplanes sp.]
MMRPDPVLLDPNAPTAGSQSALSVALRSPDMVMRLDRLGSFHQTRLSFMRVLLRRLDRDGWRLTRETWDVDARGEGVAVYRAKGPARTYSLVAFAHDLPPEKRTDRVIAEEWDATFALFDGDPTPADIERLRANVPRQEAGRVSDSEIVLARANKSVRLFEQAAACLAEGVQPRPEDLTPVGYLMRTTAVYGSGKFGLAVREAIAGREELHAPFQAEMLAVFLIRAFTFDLLDHTALVRSPQRAVTLAPTLRRSLGVGNATGLGMAPFLVNHPALLDRWITARETALARVRSQTAAEKWQRLPILVRRAQKLTATWNTTDALQEQRIADLAADLEKLAAKIDQGPFGALPYDALYRWAEMALGLEAQEMLVSLLIEPHGDLVDDLAETMACDEDAEFTIDGSMTVGALMAFIEQNYRFAITTDFSAAEAQARFWYVSEEKLEPRLGERYEEDGAEREQPLGIARDVAALYRALQAAVGDDRVATFLMQQPQFRHLVRRVQISARHPYAEVRDNLLSAAMRPVDLLRAKLACFGATRFDPKSDRWVRITMFQNAPLFDEIGRCDADDWVLPPLEGAAI